MGMVIGEASGDRMKESALQRMNEDDGRVGNR